MNIETIYQEYKAGSHGFVQAVETRCGFNISRNEIERIASKAETPEDFENVWSNETWWTDAENNSIG